MHKYQTHKVINFPVCHPKRGTLKHSQPLKIREIDSLSSPELHHLMLVDKARAFPVREKSLQFLRDNALL